MQLYRVQFPREEDQYLGTRAEAHAHAKKNFPKNLWHEAAIELVEFETDKASWLNVMNDHVPLGWKVVTRWVLTARGGLKEDNPDAAPEPKPKARAIEPPPEADPGDAWPFATRPAAR